jgi:Xaa-Pro aminopeptidase
MSDLPCGSTSSSPCSCTTFRSAGKSNHRCSCAIAKYSNAFVCSLRQPAYLSIVGSGVNSAILHYSANTRQVQDGDLVLVDAGGEYEGYGTDITRTFPANGKFTDRQREIYQIVLDAQKAAIDAVKPGASFTNLTSIALHTMAQGLLKVSYSAH